VSFLVASALAALTTATPAHRLVSGDSVIVSTEWLASHLADPALIVLAVDQKDSAYKAGHIAGARYLAFSDVIAQRNGLAQELPSVADLRAVLERLGVSTSSRVVVYGFPLIASRAFLALEYVGLNVSMLDGGLAKWTREGHPVTSELLRVSAGHLEPHVRTNVVDADWVRARLGEGHRGVALIDTRTDSEYEGTGERHMMPSDGHLSGARRLPWEELFATPNEGLFRHRAELAKLYADRTQPGDTVVTYCYVGYRASMTYLVARYLGYTARLYDGSYQDWSQRHLPLVAGKSP